MFGFVLSLDRLAEDTGAPSQPPAATAARRVSWWSNPAQSPACGPGPHEPAIAITGNTKTVLSLRNRAAGRGTPPPERVLIERIWNGRVRPEGYTDSKGNFSFLWADRRALSLMRARASSSPRSGRMRPANGVNPRDLNGVRLSQSVGLSVDDDHSDVPNGSRRP